MTHSPAGRLPGALPWRAGSTVAFDADGNAMFSTGPTYTSEHLKALVDWINSTTEQIAEKDAESARLVKENDILRASIANGKEPCIYCTLPREEWSKCQSGFPGCARADDAMLCPHVGVELETADKLAAANERIAELQSALRLPDADRRLLFISECLSGKGFFNRSDICDAFAVSVPQASADIARWITKHPNQITYNKSLKCYETARAWLNPAKEGKTDAD